MTSGHLPTPLPQQPSVDPNTSRLRLQSQAPGQAPSRPQPSLNSARPAISPTAMSWPAPASPAVNNRSFAEPKYKASSSPTPAIRPYTAPTQVLGHPCFAPVEPQQPSAVQLKTQRNARFYRPSHAARAPKPNADSRTLLRFLQLEASMHILHLRVQNATASRGTFCTLSRHCLHPLEALFAPSRGTFCTPRGTFCTPSRHFLHHSSPPLPSMQIALLTFQVATYTIFTCVSSYDCIQRAFAHKTHVQLFSDCVKYPTRVN